MKPRFPRQQTDKTTFVTRGGVRVTRFTEPIEYPDATRPLIASLDRYKGALFSSNYEHPGRYSRWDVGFQNPPVEIMSSGRHVRITTENERGQVLLRALGSALRGLSDVSCFTADSHGIDIEVRATTEFFSEEMRSRRPSVFSILRKLVEHFQSDGPDHQLGFYGAFSYSLAYQFESLRPRYHSDPQKRELLLYMPDQFVVVDHYMQSAALISYEFDIDGLSTAGLARIGRPVPTASPAWTVRSSDHEVGEYAETVRHAIDAFKAGDLFEVVPGQNFYEPADVLPSTVYDRLYRRNPAPYTFIINLGATEYLVGASPEMYVRVDGRRVETAPISGTITRTHDPISDARNILALLSSRKDESELTMCTDVDRNDKSRVCVPGSVRIVGRRQIEMYSRVIHTVDHVEGLLRNEFDAIDAFLTHAWAVTVTGAPKKWAMQFIEDHEKSPRNWYGGAIGHIGFDGAMDTGLTLRTIHFCDGVASVRAGATLLVDSDPDEEERETRLKAEVFLKAIAGDTHHTTKQVPMPGTVGHGMRLLVVDHEDSFVHTLANYFRQTGAEVVTWRSGFPVSDIARLGPDMVVLSPGPGEPSDFGMNATIAYCEDRRIPVFGICLGLQGIVEYFGGRLARLDYPMHGKASTVHVTGGYLFRGLPRTFQVGRYHSLHADRSWLPACLVTTALTDDNVVMAIEHRSLPMAAVQFHPESLLTLENDVGRRIVFNAVATFAPRRATNTVHEPLSRWASRTAVEGETR